MTFQDRKAPGALDGATGVNQEAGQLLGDSSTAKGADQVTRQKAWRLTHPEKYLAHLYVEAAKRTGFLTPLPCEICGCEKAEAHHPDYTRPGLVQWLCRGHHNQLHARGGRA